MLRRFARGEIKQQVLPGSDTRSTIPRGLPILNQPPEQNYELDCEAQKYENGDPEEFFEQEAQRYGVASNMSCVESITYVGGCLEELRDLESDELHLFENYKYKDSSDSSNTLQIAKFKEKIIQTVNSNSTVLITGVTGCGKSTQVPQFILDDCMTRKKHCNIIVTQPRRIAAISVAKQVNKERRWRNGLFVGYQVGRKRDYDPFTTKILYCTTGILLQKIIKAKNLSEFTHIILDEVHERTLEMDFLLLVIKKLMRTNSKSVRVILMSATAEAFKLCDYFGEYYGPPHNRNVPAQAINVSKTFKHKIYKYYLNDLFQSIHYASKMNLSKPQIEEAGYLTAVNLIKEFDKMELEDTHKNASVLVFLPGIYEIEEMHRLMEVAIETEKFKWTLIPLHSSITSEEQDRVFDIPPMGHRKIILSTNIAESSITVPDIKFVIDFCLMKQLKNELRSNYSMLVMTWASKSNCDQRAGRVGRVAEGRVYRLVPKSMYDNEFEAEEKPEMLRCSLSRIILMSKVLDMGPPLMLLKTAMSPPDLKNVNLTILTLKQVGALLPTVSGMISPFDGDITFMGKVMATLPLDPPMAKLIYFSYIFNILDDGIIMACGLSLKSIFSQPFKERLGAYTQKLIWANNSCSDPVAYISAFKSWLQRKPEFDYNRSTEKLWARQNFIQLSAIRELYDLTDDVSDRLSRSFHIRRNSGNMKWEHKEEQALVLKVILAGSFYPNFFVRGTSNRLDPHEVSKLMDGKVPGNTVYFTGFPDDQPKMLYKEAIENLFPAKYVGKPKALFNDTNKVFVEFQEVGDTRRIHKRKLVPDNVCFGVYVALKMKRLNFDFRIPLLNPADAAKEYEKMQKEEAKQQSLGQNKLPVYSSPVNKIKDDEKFINVQISFVESFGRFWVHLIDRDRKKNFMDMWALVNSADLYETNMIKSKPNSLKIEEIYVVSYDEYMYRAQLVSITNDPQQKFKFMLIDFGESVELSIDKVFDFANDSFKKSVLKIPKLAIECRFANIRPALNGKPVSKWCNEANEMLSKYYKDSSKEILEGNIYSIVKNVMVFENLKTKEYTFPEYFLARKMALKSEEPYESKENNRIRFHTYQNFGSSTSNQNQYKSINLQSLSLGGQHSTLALKGPINPLEITVRGINRHTESKIVSIESQSVNSILLDTAYPHDYYERLFVAGNVSVNETEKITLWDTTMMPSMAGIPAIICMIFSPSVEIRCNISYTKMIGAICGLGYDPKNARPLFAENDIEITFDTVIDQTMLEKINTVRMLLNKCVNPEDDEGPGEIFEVQHKLKNELIQIFSTEAKPKAPESVPLSRKYMWGLIPNSKQQMPYCEESPVDHPMAGSDVYKLLWGVKLESKLINVECKELLNKLCKVKRLQDNIDFNYRTCEVINEELFCPLCNYTFTSNVTMLSHFKHKLHVDHYNKAKEELQRSYTGPYEDIKHL
ncbi:ATP-dependent RNA helicase TDRD9 [Adelges cooleyi]|uniref:ATP-dependent RNA helicase TDRD9 n=1 Tax=Adelges cooleyi TaxID=133065 RepID=UPI0021807BF8|nr:ATP-dependent RNA helicase TDRD9 [Adelges cooleyi]XP_050437544.1 ATP-dependent RNA helicase TDRD9 [Adelges cooleyi]